jgi:PAS domain S-box-containing protein
MQHCTTQSGSCTAALGIALPAASFHLPDYATLLSIAVTALVVLLLMLWKRRPSKARQTIRQLQLKLHECDERFHTLVLTSNDWIWQLDADLYITYTSPQVLPILGFTPQEITGRKPVDFMNPSDAAAWRQSFENAIKNKTPLWKLENQVVTRDGRLIYLETNALPILDAAGRLQGFRGVNRDVTDRRLAEQASEEYRRRMDSLIGNLFGVAYRCSNTPDWPIEFISRGCHELTGWSPVEFVSRRIVLNDLIHPEDRLSVWRQVQKALTNRRPFNLEYRMIDRHGRLHWVVERGSGIWDHDRLEAIEGLIVDITDQKNIQQQLQENREFLESIIRSVPTGISVTRDRTFVSVNDRFCEMFGYSREELIGASARILHESQEHYDSFGRIVYTQMKASGSAVVETTFRRKDGTPIDVLMNGALLDPNDDTKGVTFNLLDITERNRVNRQLALRLKMERIIADISSGFVNLPEDGIDDQIIASLQVLVNRCDMERVRLALFDAGTNRVYLSHYLAYKPGPHLAIESDDLDRDMPEYADVLRQNRITWWANTPDDIPESKPTLRQYYREKGILSHLCIPMTVGRQHIGALLVTHLQSRLLLEEDVFGYLGVIADTLANAIVRKANLLALADSERRFRSIVESSPMAILMYQIGPDDNLVLIGTNVAASNILGFDIQSQVGQPMRQIFPDLARTDVYTIYCDICRNGGSYRGTNFTYKDAHVTGVYDFEAFQTSPGRIAIMFSDVTERRQAEQARERLMRQLSAKNEDLESIVFIASHDLRSPLVNIRGFSGELEKSAQALADLLHQETLTDAGRVQSERILTSDIPESLRFINSGSAKMENMLNGLLRLSRVSAAQSRPCRIDVSDLLKRVLTDFKYLTKTGDVSIEIAPDLPACLGDPFLVGQVFSNLIDNAIKYRSPARALSVSITARTAGAFVEYRVADNGIGIAPEHVGKVFDIFHQLNPAAGNGQGLGLTIVKKIIDAQEGAVAIESAPDAGTTVILKLPKP